MSNSFYEKFGGFWYESIGNFWFPRQHRKLASFILQRPEMNILDVGCGTGKMLKIIANKFAGANLYGVDSSPSMINFAKQKYPNFNFRIASAESLPFEDQKFDIVTNSNSFHHYPNPEQAIREVFRVLKPKRQFLLMDTIPTTNYKRKILDFLAKNIIRDGHIGYKTLDEIKGILNKLDFKNITDLSINFPDVKIISSFKD